MEDAGGYGRECKGKLAKRCADWHLQGVLSSSFADYEVNISLAVYILHASMSKPSVRRDGAVGDSGCR